MSTSVRESNVHHHPETLDLELAAMVKWTWGFYYKDSVSVLYVWEGE